MKKKKLTAFILSIAAVLTSFSGCNQIPPEEQGADIVDIKNTAEITTTQTSESTSLTTVKTEPQTEDSKAETGTDITTEEKEEETRTTAEEAEKMPVSAEEQTLPPRSESAPAIETEAVTEKNEETTMLKEILTASDMVSVISEQAAQKQLNGNFIDSQLEFAVKMFQNSYAGSSGKNMLISPLSAIPALTMAANGAKGDTLSEFENVLGGGINIEEFNGYLSSYLNSLSSGRNFKLNLADSVWIKDDDKLTVEPSFLQTNQSYYDAQIFREPFNNATVEKINSWVNKNTDGMIERIINQLDAETVMCLVNALSFDAKWTAPYDSDYDVSDGTFTLTNGTVRTAEMMFSTENVYLKGNNAIGFMKPYKGGKYSFAAILPNKGTTPLEYINSLSADELKRMLGEKEKCPVETQMPKFSFDYDIQLDSVLKNMGITKAFDVQNADFSGIGKIEGNNIYVGSVLQKTFIAVDEDGTKAGASTVVAMAAGTTAIQQNKKKVYLDRPFVFMIVDNESSLPIFMGCVEDVGK